MYGLCTQFNVLPASGGVYEQDPRLLREWTVIGEEVAKVQNSEIETVRKQTNFQGNSVKKKYIPPNQNKSYSSGKVGGVNFKRVPPIPKTFQKYYNEEL